MTLLVFSAQQDASRDSVCWEKEKKIWGEKSWEVFAESEESSTLGIGPQSTKHFNEPFSKTMQSFKP